jgi:hypothetical protein
MYIQATGELALFTAFSGQKLFVRLPPGYGGEPRREGKPVGVGNDTATAPTASPSADSSVSSVSMPTQQQQQQQQQQQYTESPVVPSEKGVENVVDMSTRTRRTLIESEPSSSGASLVMALFDAFTMRMRTYALGWITIANQAAVLLTNHMDSFGILRRQSTVTYSRADEDFPSAHFMDIINRERDQQLDSVSSQEIDYNNDHRNLQAMPGKATFQSYSSKVGFELVMIDTATNQLEVARMLPFGADKLPATFQKLVNDHSRGLGPVESNRNRAIINAKSKDPSISLPSCPILGSLRSLPVAKFHREGRDNSVVSLDESDASESAQFVSTIVGSLDSDICGRQFNISMQSLASEVKLCCLFVYKLVAVSFARIYDIERNY